MQKGKLDRQEVNRAQVGPRQLKDPRSREYAIQTVYCLKAYLESRDLDEGLIRKELAVIEKYHHWEILGYPSKDALLEAETGRKEIDIDRMLKLKHETEEEKQMAQHGQDANSKAG